ncbi:MAG: phosphotransferase [Acidimicrobiales bacterium]
MSGVGSFAEYARSRTSDLPHGTLAIVGGEGGNRWLGCFDRQILRAPLRSIFSDQRLRPVIAKERAEGPKYLNTLIEEGKVTPVIDRTFPLREAPRGNPVSGARSPRRQGRRHALTTVDLRHGSQGRSARHVVATLQMCLTSCETVVTLDTPSPVALDDTDLAEALAANWKSAVDEIRYLPKGAGSYHWIADISARPQLFITVDDLDTKPWIGETRDSTFEGLRDAYEAARVLHDEGGFAFVVAPLRCTNGSTVLRLADQYSMAVFPFVEGRAGAWGDPLADTDRDALLGELATLHKPTAVTDVRIAHRRLHLPERPDLAAALDELDRPWMGGSLSEPARHVLAAHAEKVTSWLEQLDLLGRQLGEAEETAVLTHGEPHPGNLIHTADGLRLIDWDTVALARRERDLWMLHDGSPQCLMAYERLTGTTINETAISFYRLAWTLSDIASFANMFRSPHQETQWTRTKWKGFQQLLGGAPSAPYAPTSSPATGVTAARRATPSV